MRTVLYFSRFFPPSFAVGGKRAYRFARYLPEFGWRPVVVTAPIPPDAKLDPTAGAGLPPEVTLHRTYYPGWWPQAAGKDSDGTVAAPTRAALPKRAAGPLGWLERQVRMPVGDDLLTTPHMAMTVRQLVAAERPDAIVASSSPYSALLYGAMARAAAGVPLCLDLRDPWTLNFFQARKPSWVRQVEARLERWLFQQADRVTLTCESAADAYRARYPELGPEHFLSITNAFDPAQRPARPSAPPDGPVTLVHFGNCYGPRRLATLLRALAVLRGRDGLGPDRLRLLNLGRPAEEDLHLASSLGVSDQLESRPFVPYDEGLSILAAADAQILLAYGDETLYLPAKLYDYLLTGAPILCVSQPSELTGIIADTKAGLSVGPDDLEAAVDAVARVVAARASGLPVTTPDPEAVDRYSARNTARQLAELLDTLAAEARPERSRTARPAPEAAPARPALSVVIPIRNRSGDRVANCLRSLRWQDLPSDRYEVLISDYGSAPEHAASLAALAAEHGARVVSTDVDTVWNRSHALNLAIRQARGEFVLCTDADMIFAPDFLSSLLAEQAMAGGRAMVVCRCRDLPEDVPEQAWTREDWPTLLARSSWRPTLGTGACQMARRDHFERVQGYDERYVFWGMEDNDMLFRAKRAGLEVRWVHDRTAMLHQWHPSDRGKRPLRKFLNDARFHVTKYRTVKNPRGWGQPPGT